MISQKNIFMQEGTVKFFNDSKGFGFIIVEETGKEIFVHTTNLIDEIREGDKVTFNTELGPKGVAAIDVKRM